MALCQWIAAIAVVYGTFGFGTIVRGHDFVCRVSQDAVAKFVAAACPITVEGTKRLTGPAVAIGEIRWKATVRKPQVILGRTAQTFSASAEVRIPGMNLVLECPVKGRLKIDYDAGDSALVVKMHEAVADVNAGLFSTRIDVSADIPVFRFKVAMPEVSLPDGGAVIQVVADPQIEFQDGFVEVSSELTFRSSDRRR